MTFRLITLFSTAFLALAGCDDGAKPVAPVAQSVPASLPATVPAATGPAEFVTEVLPGMRATVSVPRGVEFVSVGSRTFIEGKFPERVFSFAIAQPAAIGLQDLTVLERTSSATPGVRVTQNDNLVIIDERPNVSSGPSETPVIAKRTIYIRRDVNVQLIEMASVGLTQAAYLKDQAFYDRVLDSLAYVKESAQ